jgi:sodium/potassium-transporting ATPase subunit alpha
MTRNPRRPEEHMVTAKLLIFGYVQFGIIHASCGFLQWFIVMNDFGMPSSSLFGMALLAGAQPLPSDSYDPHSPWLGNSTLKDLYQANGDKCLKSDEGGFGVVDWLYRDTDYVDLR